MEGVTMKGIEGTDIAKRSVPTVAGFYRAKCWSNDDLEAMARQFASLGKDAHSEHKQMAAHLIKHATPYHIFQFAISLPEIFYRRRLMNVMPRNDDLYLWVWIADTMCVAEEDYAMNRGVMEKMLTFLSGRPRWSLSTDPAEKKSEPKPEPVTEPEPDPEALPSRDRVAVLRAEGKVRREKQIQEEIETQKRLLKEKIEREARTKSDSFWYFWGSVTVFPETKRHIYEWVNTQDGYSAKLIKQSGTYLIVYFQDRIEPETAPKPKRDSLLSRWWRFWLDWWSAGDEGGTLK